MNVIITGTSKGIGFELTKKFTKSKGCHIIAIARNIKTLEVLSNELIDNKSKSFLYPLACDIGRKGFEKRILEFVLTKFDRIDILVNNAGILINKPFEELNDIDFDHMFDVNTKAPFFIIKTFLPYFKRYSRIVNIGSMGGYQGSSKFPGLSLYSASKGAVAIFSECLAEELKGKGIHVNCLALGAVETDMFHQAFPGLSAKISAEQMAEYIFNFSINKPVHPSGRIIPVDNLPWFPEGK